jgi:hypothetical protein
MFVQSNLPYIQGLNSKLFYGYHLIDNRNATNRLRIISKLGVTDLYYNFECKAVYNEFKAMLGKLPTIQGESMQLSKLHFVEKKGISEENAHRETFVRYWIAGEYVTLKVESLNKAKKLASVFCKSSHSSKKVVLIKETLNGEKFTFPEDSKSIVYVFCILKVRKFAMPRYSMVVARNDEGRQQAIFRRRN